MSKLFIALGILVLVAIGAVLVVWHATPTSALPITSDMSLTPNAADPDLTDIALYDAKTHQQKTLTLSDVYRDHYHPAEFMDGELYVIKRPGGEDAYMTNSAWTDELWKYDLAGNGTKVFAAQGLDFRVSTGTGRIAIALPQMDATGTIFVLTDLQGHVLQSLTRSDLKGLGQDEQLGPLMWSGDLFWFSSNEGQSLTHIFSLDASDRSIMSYPTSDLGTTVGEFDLEPLSKTLVYSNFVSALSVPEITQNVTLSLYQLSTGDKRTLMTFPSMDHGLEPKWMSTSSIEYIDPDGMDEGAIQL